MSTRRTYTREFKIKAVKLLRNSDKSVDAMAETLGVSRSSLNRWQREFGADPDQAFPATVSAKNEMRKWPGCKKRCGNHRWRTKS